MKKDIDCNIKQLNSDEKNTHVIKKNLDKSNDVSNLSDNTEEINISLKDVVVDVRVWIWSNANVCFINVYTSVYIYIHVYIYFLV